MSSFFELFKTIGLITGKNPPLIHGGHLYTTIGNSYNSYDFKLGYRYSGPQLETDITCIAALERLIYAAIDQDIHVIERRTVIRKLTGHNKKITRMITFSGLLLSFDTDNTCIIWDGVVEISRFTVEGTVTALLHPSTYLDKIVVGTQEGHLSIWNLRVGKLVYRMNFKNPITCLENSPCLDTIGIGFANGDILIHNIKKDKNIATFKHHPGPVKSLSFRLDQSDYFASGNGNGELAIWNLAEKKLTATVAGVHNSITSVFFIPGEPLIMTAGEDNTLKLLRFDRVDKPELHRDLSGNRESPHFVRFYDPQGSFLLSVDSTIKIIRVQNGHTDRFGDGKQSLPKIVDFDFCYLRQGDWDNVVTAHNNKDPKLWNARNHVINKQKSLFDKKGANVKVVKMSICGNFAVVGGSDGSLYRWNVQSATKTMKYIDADKFAHNMSITGLAINMINSIISSCSLDGFLKFWNFESGKLINKINMESSIIKMISQTNMIALVLNDGFEIVLFDVQTMRSFRKFQNSESTKYNDVIFSHDGKFLLACNDETSLFVWDIITGNLVSWIKCKTPVLSLAFHPEGLFLATSHLDSVGINLWVNRHLFGKATLCKITKPTMFYEIENLLDTDMGEFDGLENTIDVDESNKLIRTSGLTKNVFYTITHLEEIREKSKLESTKTRIIAPFFLSEAPKIEVETVQSKEVKQNDFVQRKLVDLLQKRDRSAIIAYLKECNPKQIDLSLRCLSPMYNLMEIREFLEFLIQEVTILENFDLIQALLNVFLNIHSEMIVSSESIETFEKIEELKEKQKIAYDRLNDLIIANTSLSKVFTN
jgi:U3 small nucleolar RNA-associated protein 21